MGDESGRSSRELHAAARVRVCSHVTIFYFKISVRYSVNNG